MIILPTGKARPFRPSAILAIISEMLVNLKNQFVSPGGVGFPNGRSFVRYVDFACPSGVASQIVDSMSTGSPKILMYNHGTNGASLASGVVDLTQPIGSSASAPTITHGYGLLDLSATGINPTYLIKIDFGVQAIGGYSTSATGNGIYEFKIDEKLDGSFSYSGFTHRLLGDVDGNKAVDTTDYAKVIDRAVFGKYGMYAEDTNGAGRVASKDISFTLQQRGQYLANISGLNLQ
jgi:hypothetical protein